MAAREEARPVGRERHRADAAVCPSKVRSSRPVAASQSLTVLSPPPESRREPSAETAADLMPSECGMLGTISTLGRSWALAAV